MNFHRLITYFLFILFSCHLSAVPVITSVSPSSGDVAGGDVITITGSGFTGATAVDFGFRPATLFVVLDDTSISATSPPGTSGTFDITVTAAAQTSVTSRDDFYTYTQNSWTGIVSAINMNIITLFDTGTNTLNLSIPLAADSLSCIITPDGTRIYAAHSTVANVSEIDVATGTIIANIPTPVAGIGAFDIIVSPDGSRVYVSNFTSGYVTVIDTLSNTVVADILTAPALGPLSITPDGTTLYVSSFALGSVMIIDTATNTVTGSIPTGVVPGMIAITPDGITAYVCNLGSDTISIIDVATNLVTGTIVLPPGSGPYGSFILPNGTLLYVANFNTATMSVIDIATNAIVTTIPLLAGSEPFWLVSTPDSQTIYVINQTIDDITPIDVATNAVGTSFGGIGGAVQDIVMSPDQAPVASFTASLQPAGLPSAFDASASLSPIGTIVSYAWDFGDGDTLVTNTPIVNHVYLTSGAFNVTLTVTNSAGTSISKVFSSRFMSNNGGPEATVTELFAIAPLPPTDVNGFQTACKYASQTDLVNVITWNPPTLGEAPVAYRIYRDASLTDLAGTVQASGELVFYDHNRRKNRAYTYYIVSVGATGAISTPVSITITPK